MFGAPSGVARPIGYARASFAGLPIFTQSRIFTVTVNIGEK